MKLANCSRFSNDFLDGGHSLLVIEHNLDVIRSADWVIDLGPDAGDEGGQIVAQGTPEQVAAWAESHTGQALAEAFVRRGVSRSNEMSATAGGMDLCAFVQSQCPGLKGRCEPGSFDSADAS